MTFWAGMPYVGYQFEETGGFAAVFRMFMMSGLFVGAALALFLVSVRGRAKLSQVLIVASVAVALTVALPARLQPAQYGCEVIVTVPALVAPIYWVSGPTTDRPYQVFEYAEEKSSRVCVGLHLPNRAARSSLSS